MASFELTSDKFWLSQSVHVALPPDMNTPPAGLIQIAQPHLPEGGCLFRTSGTTGEPKWVALEKRALLHSARVVNAHYDLTQKDRWMCTLPDHHVGGFSIYARCCLSKSHLIFLSEKWNPISFLSFLECNEISVTSIVPTQLHDLVQQRLQSPPCLRLLMVGGGRLDPTLMQAALDLGWPACATYGMTETASQVASQSLDHDRHNDPESMEVLPHWETRTNANDTLTVLGPALAKGYILMTAEGPIWETIDPEWGLSTRDQVQLLRNGSRTFLKFLGRDHSFVKILGELVHLDTLEQRLRRLCPATYPPITLLALPDPRREHVLVLAVESEKWSSDFDRVLFAFNQTCAPFERISHQICLSEFPRAGISKLNLSLLRQLAAAQLGIEP